jgi:hypothetical protein
MATGALPFRGKSSGVILDGMLYRLPVAPIRLNPASRPGEGDPSAAWRTKLPTLACSVPNWRPGLLGAIEESDRFDNFRLCRIRACPLAHGVVLRQQSEGSWKIARFLGVIHPTP